MDFFQQSLFCLPLSVSQEFKDDLSYHLSSLMGLEIVSDFVCSVFSCLKAKINYF